MLVIKAFQTGMTPIAEFTSGFDISVDLALREEFGTFGSEVEIIFPEIGFHVSII